MNEKSRIIRYTTEAIKLTGNPRFMAPCVAGVFMLIVGTVLGVQYSFNMAAVLFTLPIASYLLAVFSLRGLTVSRMRVPAIRENDKLHISTRVETSGMSPRLRLKLVDTMPDSVKSDIPDGIELALCVSGPVRIKYEIQPVRRGVYDIGPIYISSMDPLGIFEFRKNFGQRSQLAVYPRSQPVPLGKLLGAEGAIQDDAVSHGKKGQGLDLHGVRDYTPGDPLRRIHWKTTARRGSLVVAEFEQAVSAELVIAVECHKGTEAQADNGSTLDVATRIAAYTAETMLRHGVPVKLLLANRASVTTVSAKTNEDMEQILYALAKAKADADFNLSDVIGSTELGSDQVLVLITPAIDDDLVRALSSVASYGVHTGVILIPGMGPVNQKLQDNLRSSGTNIVIVEGGQEDG